MTYGLDFPSLPGLGDCLYRIWTPRPGVRLTSKAPVFSTRSCGIDKVDNFFKRTANKLERAGNLRVHVLTEPDGAIIGFYALNAHSFHYADLPENFKRDRPGTEQFLRPISP